MADYSWMTNSTKPKTQASTSGSSSADGLSRDYFTKNLSNQAPTGQAAQTQQQRMNAFQSGVSSGMSDRDAYNSAMSFGSPQAGVASITPTSSASGTMTKQASPYSGWSAAYNQAQQIQDPAGYAQMKDRLNQMNQPTQPQQPSQTQGLNNAIAQQRSSWNLPGWNNTPSTGTSLPSASPGTQAQSPGYGYAWDSSKYGPQNFTDKNEPVSRYIENVLPLAQFEQNAYQYGQDFNEAQRRWDAEYGMTQGMNQFNMGLQSRQQMSAEEQARIAAEQWNQQFGWQQNTDQWNRDLSQQQINNQYAMGMDQNQASRDVAGTYAGAQRYGSDQQLAGQLGSAGIYAGAQNYGAELGLQGQLGSAGMYSDAQRYQAQQNALAQMYGADQNLAGAGLYSSAQRYNSDMQRRIAQIQAQAQVQAANVNAYGRSQAPRAQWASQWS